MNGRLLGKMVHSLKGLDTWLRTLRQSAPGVQLPYQARDCTPAFSWYLQLLRVSPHLVETDLFFHTEAELTKVLKSIQSSTPTLRNVSFKTLRPTSPGQPRVLTYLHLVQLALKSNQLGALEHLGLGYLRVHPYVPLLRLEGPALVSLAVLESCKGPKVHEIIPADLSRLRRLHLSFSTERVDLNGIIGQLSHRVEYITIERPNRVAEPLPLDQYPHPPSIPAIPIDDFLRFQNLRSLELRGFVGPSLTLLQQLSSSCQQLTSLDFNDSFWISHSSCIPQPPSPDYFQAVFPEDLVITELRKLQYLKALNLGTLPTTDEDDYERLESEMQTRGIEFEWERCWTEPYYCDECDSYHEGY